MSQKTRVIYTPEGGSKRVWEVDFENPAWDISFNTEKVTDWPWADFNMKLARGSAIALRALIWTLRKRDEPKLALESVTVTLDEFDLEDLEPDAAEGDDAEDAAGDPKA